VPALHALNADLSDVAAFISRPAPAVGGLVHCHVARVRSSGGAVAYSLYIEGPNPERIAAQPLGARFLLHAAKQRGRGASHYVMSLDPPAGEGGRSAHAQSASPQRCAGHVRSNFIGTEFVATDGADRREIVSVLYGVNVLGSRGPRRMMGAVPAPAQQPTRGALARAARADACDTACVLLRPKAPRWNGTLGAFCLNFHGRVALASVKNFQLVADGSGDSRTPTLQFGKVNEELFTLDYAHPMTAAQAFAVALTAFDGKLACE
jgi:tubby-related protein 1